jgi:hypothetical protein
MILCISFWLRSSFPAGYVKGEVVPIHIIKDLGWRRGTAPLILNLSAIWRWVANLTLRPPYLLESTPALTEYEAGSGRFWEDKTSCPCRDSTSGLSSYTNWSIQAPTAVAYSELAARSQVCVCLRRRLMASYIQVSLRVNSTKDMVSGWYLYPNTVLHSTNM